MCVPCIKCNNNQASVFIIAKIQKHHSYSSVVEKKIMSSSHLHIRAYKEFTAVIVHELTRQHEGINMSRFQNIMQSEATEEYIQFNSVKQINRIDKFNQIFRSEYYEIQM